jgi:hypothetical protein
MPVNKGADKMLNDNSRMDEVTPREFHLGQNYPNPFKNKTVIKYCIGYKTKVVLSVYNSEGEMIEKLVDEEKKPGTYEVGFCVCHSRESRNLKEGELFYRLEAGDYRSEKKMIMEK